MKPGKSMYSYGVFRIQPSLLVQITLKILRASGVHRKRPKSPRDASATVQPQSSAIVAVTP